MVSALAFNMEGSMGKTVVPLEEGIVCPWIASLLVGNTRICIDCSVFLIPHKKKRSHQDECSRAHQGKGRWWRVSGSCFGAWQRWGLMLLFLLIGIHHGMWDEILQTSKEHWIWTVQWLRSVFF